METLNKEKKSGQFKFALINCYLQGGHVATAEVEACHRLTNAAKNIGADLQVFAKTEDALLWGPDVVLLHSYQDAKLSGVLTYGLLTMPIEWVRYNRRFLRNILSYDGYMAVSDEVLLNLERFIKRNFKQASSIPAAFSISKRNFSILKFDNPYCAYVGTNWDGNRHGSLWNNGLLIGRLKCFGPKESWNFLPTDLYGGSVPFDGQSLISVYRNAGIGLELNHPDFDEEGIPTSRTFEIPASSAITIAREGSFSHQVYGDSILVVKNTDTALGQAQQISQHVDWVKANPEQAIEMAKTTNELFNANFSLESHLSEIISQAARDKLQIRDRLKSFKSACTLIVSQEESSDELNPDLIQQINKLKIISDVIFLCNESNLQTVTDKARKCLEKPFFVCPSNTFGRSNSQDLDLISYQIDILKRNKFAIFTNFQSKFYERELIRALDTVENLFGGPASQIHKFETIFCAGIVEKTNDGQHLPELLEDSNKIKRSDTRRISQFGSGYLKECHQASQSKPDTNGCIVHHRSLIQAMQSNGEISSSLKRLKSTKEIFFLPEVYVEAQYRDGIRTKAVNLACYELKPAKPSSVSLLKHNAICQRILNFSYRLVRYLKKYG